MDNNIERAKRNLADALAAGERCEKPDAFQQHTIDPSGLWVGWMVSEVNPRVLVPLRANMGQHGMVMTAAVEIDSPQCFALSSGTGAGMLVGDQLTLMLKLNDGGTLTIKQDIHHDRGMPVPRDNSAG